MHTEYQSPIMIRKIKLTRTQPATKRRPNTTLSRLEAIASRVGCDLPFLHSKKDSKQKNNEAQHLNQ